MKITLEKDNTTITIDEIEPSIIENFLNDFLVSERKVIEPKKMHKWAKGDLKPIPMRTRLGRPIKTHSELMTKFLPIKDQLINELKTNMNETVVKICDKYGFAYTSLIPYIPKEEIMRTRYETKGHKQPYFSGKRPKKRRSSFDVATILNEKREEIVNDLRTTTMSVPEIAKKYDLSPSTFYNKFRKEIAERFELKEPKETYDVNGFSPLQRDVILQAIKDGKLNLNKDGKFLGFDGRKKRNPDWVNFLVKVHGFAKKRGLKPRLDLNTLTLYFE